MSNGSGNTPSQPTNPATPAAPAVPQSPTPTSAETEQPGSTPAPDDGTPAGGDEPAGSPFNFEKFNTDFDEVGEVDEPSGDEPGGEPAQAPSQTPPGATPSAPQQPAAEPAPAAAGQPPAAKPAEPPAGQPPAATQPKPGEGQPPATSPAQPEGQPPAQEPEAPPAAAQPSAEELKANYTKWRQESETRLAQMYTLAPEDAEKMLSNPEEVLPKIAARLHLDVFEAAVQDLYGRMPQMVAHYVGQMNTTKQHEDAFYGQFPKLRGREGDVQKFAAAFRQVNPQLKPDEFMKQVGMALYAAFGLSFDEPPAGGNGVTPPAGASPESAGAAPGGPAVVARDIVTPEGSFQPAPSGGVTPQAPGGGKPQTIWDEMAQQLLEDDS